MTEILRALGPIPTTEGCAYLYFHDCDKQRGGFWFESAALRTTDCQICHTTQVVIDLSYDDTLRMLRALDRENLLKWENALNYREHHQELRNLAI